MKKPRHRKRNRTEDELDSFADDSNPHSGPATDRARREDMKFEGSEQLETAVDY
jgi:hypothetical protein